VTEGFVIPESKSNAAWFDEDTLLVGGYEESGINHLGYPRVVKVWRRGQELSKAEMLFEGKFEHYGVWAGDLEEKKCLIHEGVSWDEGKTYLYDHSRKLKQLHLPLEARAIGLFDQDVIFNLHKDFKGYKAGSVLQVSLEKAFNNSHQDQFKVIAQDTKESFIDGIEILKDSFLTFTLKNVSHELWHYKKESDTWKAERLQIPEQSTVTAVLEDAVTKQVFVVSENFLTPKAVSQLKADNSLLFLKKAKDIFTGNFTVQQNWAKSTDGTSIPYFVVHKKDLKLDSTHPTLLNAYGGFTISKLPMYMPAPGKLWLEKGGVFVLANIRGGAEFGMNWHRSAILENKQKSYDDFIAVAEDLISRKYTTSERLGIRGGSNGGLLMGAVTTQRPDLFKAVLCEVPLLDMIRYVELPPGASWMDEYGDPRNEKMREVILKYSPYQNVHKEKKYPKIFFHTSITDDRVHPSHARRMAAKMLEQGHELFFYEESEGGHGSGDLKTKAFAEAMSFSYLWMMLG
jgi:prolyl oligopeptidase